MLRRLVMLFAQFGSCPTYPRTAQVYTGDDIGRSFYRRSGSIAKAKQSRRALCFSPLSQAGCFFFHKQQPGIYAGDLTHEVGSMCVSFVHRDMGVPMLVLARGVQSSLGDT